VVELYQSGQRLFCQAAVFALEKDLRLPDPGLVYTIQSENWLLVVDLSARALARFVALSFCGATKCVIFSDNFFDLPAGRMQRVNCPLPTGWNLEQARQNLIVRSLADVKPAGTALSDRIQRLLIGLKPANLAGQLFSRLM